jgi:hypothetical protein
MLPIVRPTLLGSALLLAACGGDAPPRADAGSGGDADADAGAGSAAPAVQVSGGSRGEVPLTIDATVGGRRLQARGTGECQHTADASIYDVPAALWRASWSADGEGDDGLRHLNLTLWEPQGGGATQITLSLQVGETSHRIGTVPKGTVEGKGTASVERAGEGGGLAVEGETGEGTPLRLTVRCERFTVPVAEGG